MYGQLNILKHAFRRFYLNQRGQDLIEYALLAAFVAVAVSAFLPPAVAPAISGVFSKISSLLSRAPN
ncbi:MAG: Flp family type IVb pilin [Bryobacteraceae bacterium]|nr:Flp family type IVb pilin [Bryobacteraceae bacterium]